MNAVGHRVVNAGFALIVAYQPALVSFFSIVREGSVIAFLVGLVAASSLPDDLEMRRFHNGTSQTMIPHRTWTHWWPIWIALYFFVLSLSSLLPAWAEGLFLGLIFGSLLHILADAITTGGVPFLYPMSCEKGHFGCLRLTRLKSNSASLAATSIAVLAVITALFVQIDFFK